MLDFCRDVAAHAPSMATSSIFTATTTSRIQKASCIILARYPMEEIKFSQQVQATFSIQPATTSPTDDPVLHVLGLIKKCHATFAYTFSSQSRVGTRVVVTLSAMQPQAIAVVQNGLTRTHQGRSMRSVEPSKSLAAIGDAQLSHAYHESQRHTEFVAPL